jgi:hypothetical protein
VYAGCFKAFNFGFKHSISGTPGKERRCVKKRDVGNFTRKISHG